MALEEKEQKIEGFSADTQEEKLAALKNLVPEAFSEGGIDAEKLRGIFDTGHFAENEEGERFRLEWAGKRKVFDEIARRTSCTLALDEARSSKDFKDSQNVFIEGENLEVLRMLQKAYHGKVKMIYIDPPYNTGHDFVYNDDFRQTEEKYNEDFCNLDENGNIKRAYAQNSKDSGRYHSNWLSMMYPRLYLARNLLRDDGVIFVSIDDNEAHNLRAILNEVFGEENFIAQFIHKNNSSKNQSKLVSVSTEYFYCYAKRKDDLKDISWRIKKRGAKDVATLFAKLKLQGKTLEEISEQVKELYSRPKYAHLSRWNKVDEIGVFKDADLSREGGSKEYTIINPDTGNACIIPERGWGKSHEELLRLQSENQIWYGDENTPPGLKDYINSDDESVPDNFWYFDNSPDTRWVKSVFNGLVFENPKPVEMMKQVVQMASNGTDIILDFFSGSATTAHAVMAQNVEDGGSRTYICVQMPETTPEDSEARKAGYTKISDIAIDRIKKAAEKIRKEYPEYLGDLGVRVYRETDSNFPQWHSRAFDSDEELTNSLLDYAKRVPDGDEHARAVEVLLKLGYPLTTPLEKREGFLMADESVALVLASDFKSKNLDNILAQKPSTVVVLEKIFTDDNEKINFSLKCKEQKIVFQTL